MKQEFNELLEEMTNNDLLLMKSIVHNKVLLMVILSKLGMEDKEIDDLNKKIYDNLEKEIRSFDKKEEKNVKGE